MKLANKYLILFLTLLFPALFYKVGAGVNVLLYNIILLAIGLFLQPSLKNNLFYKLNSFALIVTGLASLIHASHFTLWVNGILLLLQAGIYSAPYAKSLLYHFYQGLNNINGMFSKPDAASVIAKQSTNTKFAFWHKIPFKQLGIYIIPGVIIFIFLRIYANANPIFENFFSAILDKFEFIWKWIKDFLPKLSLTWILLAFIGFVIAKFMFQGIRNSQFMQKEMDLSNFMERNRLLKSKLKFNTVGLKLEYKTGIFLFVGLNIILFLLNITDIHEVWFKFSFDGNGLKSYVHNGTYQLLISIFIAAGIVLFYFRKNLNFFKTNHWLKKLAIIWIAQNIVLTLSVAVRTFQYINHFGLAYKRIALLFGLVFLIGFLILIIFKIFKANSTYYINKNTFIVAYVIIVVSGFWDWAGIIANHNLKNAGKSYVHYNFLQSLPDRCLPNLINNMGAALEIEENQVRDYVGEIKPNDMGKYQTEVEERVIKFVTFFEKASWKEWTLQEQKAYNALKNRRL